MLCTKFQVSKPSDSEEDFQILSYVFLCFKHRPLAQGHFGPGYLHSNKLNKEPLCNAKFQASSGSEEEEVLIW